MRAKLLHGVAPLLAALLALPAQADTLIDNVNGITLDDHGGVNRFTGLLIGADGRVAQLLRSGDKRPRKVDYLLDGKGRVLMPGLVDAHANVMATGFAALTLDLSDAPTLAAAQNKIAAYAAANPDRPWIIGRGWSAERWGLSQPPTSAQLDAAVANRPAWLISAAGDAGWANTAALTVAGITASTRPPAGGRIEHGDGARPSGVLVGTAMPLVDRVVPAPRPEDRDLAFSKAQQLFLSHGFTTVTDIGTRIEDWQAYRRAGDSGRLRMRIIGYADGTDAMALIAGPAPTMWLYGDRLKLNGVSLAIDSTLSSRGALLTAPYADEPGTSGLNQYSDTQLNNLMSRAAIDTFQVAITAHGDGAVRMALDAIDQLVPTYRGERRWRIDGADVVAAPDIARLGRNGIALAMQPSRLTSLAGVDEARLGPARLGSVQPWRSLAANGAMLAFGSGAPAGPPDAFATLATVLSRQDRTGQPAERLDPAAALAAFTTGGAKAAMAETRIGRLDKGMRADFLLVDRDPLLASEAELASTHILQVWVGGQQVLNSSSAYQ